MAEPSSGTRRPSIDTSGLIGVPGNRNTTRFPDFGKPFRAMGNNPKRTAAVACAALLLIGIAATVLTMHCRGTLTSNWGKFSGMMKTTHAMKNWQIVAAAAGTVGGVGLGVLAYKSPSLLSMCKRKRNERSRAAQDDAIDRAEGDDVPGPSKGAKVKAWAGDHKKQIAAGVATFVALAAIAVLSVHFHSQINNWMGKTHAMNGGQMCYEVIAPAVGFTMFVAGLLACRKAYKNRSRVGDFANI